MHVQKDEAETFDWFCGYCRFSIAGNVDISDSKTIQNFEQLLVLLGLVIDYANWPCVW
jgi:hypothetical protein